mgnify:CR=1 FL=1
MTSNHSYMTSNHVQLSLVDFGIYDDIQDVTQDDIQDDIQDNILDDIQDNIQDEIQDDIQSYAPNDYMPLYLNLINYFEAGKSKKFQKNFCWLNSLLKTFVKMKNQRNVLYLLR